MNSHNGWLAGWQSSTRGISQIQKQAKEPKTFKQNREKQ
jgi:hypothetical protein